MRRTNKISRSVKVLAIVMTGLFAAGSMAHADSDRRGCGGKDGGRDISDSHLRKGMDRMAERLDLSQAQQKEIEAIYQSARQEMAADGERMRDLHRQIHALDPADRNYIKDVTRLARQQGELIEKQAVARARTRQAAHKVLTPEQQAAANAFRDERKGRMYERHEERRERRMERDD